MTDMEYTVSDKIFVQPLTFRRLQDEQRPWVQHNFPGRDSYYPLLGAVEEYAELLEEVARYRGYEVPDEEWRPISGFENSYAISNRGRVKRVSTEHGTVPGKILSSYMLKDGYLVTTLSFTQDGQHKNKKVLTHVLVAEAFIGKRPDGMDINHINGIKMDNRLWNLEYVSRSDNMKKAIALGLFEPTLKRRPGASNERAKLSDDDVSEMKMLYADGITQQELADMYGIARETVGQVVRGEKYTNSITYTETVKKMPYDPNALRGVGIALGRLSHAYLKKKQGIRGTDAKHDADMGDAVADAVIYLADFCSAMGFDFQDIMERTWSEVKQRDWIKYPLNGVSQ
jgi:DNA-binding XRE family transcriptional regulator